ncbi:MAG TPA: 2-C-methyl-D-erythritol 2,4-cyclodiphosphate synthase [Gemmatimonadales bacterium]|nr:2-C-methyl-D-erythritol 2,4-cyclodiphosphate synthase [Gemmatimonadales bacterium]
MSRTGIGYDSHRFVEGRSLVLGGQVIPHERGLAGHSDADAVAHALTDAILGAAAAGDIGRLFPDTDPRWKGADSIQLLKAAVEHAHNRGWKPVQADITVLLERPKLVPYLAAMVKALSDATGIPAEALGLKAKTNEGMGFVGRGEGIAVIAVATLDPA